MATTRRSRGRLPESGTAAVVLAAGTSSRMGRVKPLVEIGGTSLLARTLDSVREAGLSPIVLVLGDRAAQIRERVDLHGVSVIENPAYRTGMSSSLRAGVGAVGDRARHVAIVLADQPMVRPLTLRALVRRAAGGEGRIFLPTYHGVWGNPVVFDVSLAPELDRLQGDVGCRGMFPGHADEIREVAVDDPGILVDLDTPEEVAVVDSAIRRGDAVGPLLARIAAPRLALHASPKEHPVPRRLRRPVDINAEAERLRTEGREFVLATVVRAVRPTSGRPGYKAIIHPDGTHRGWVGGACTEHLLVSESLAALAEDAPRLLRVTPDVGAEGERDEGVVTRKMVCQSGGAVEIFIEPNVPRPTLIVVGDSPVATTLATLAPVLGFRVVLVAPGAEAHDLPDVDALVGELERLPPLLGPTVYAVVASMGKYDEAALAPIARSTVAYAGLVASRKRANSVLAAIREDGVTDVEIARVRCPAGLDIAASTPEEIALSVLAEIVRVRRTAPPKPSAPEPEASGTGRASGTAVDPVCHMDVETTSPLRATHRGTTYYFCSDGCRRRFRRTPARFLSA